MTQDSKSEFAQLMTHLRKLRSMSQGQLAQATQLSRTYIYHLETGQRTNPTPQVIKGIARALDLAPSERESLYEAYTTLTGHLIEEDPADSTLLDLGELASLLVHNTSYPAHALDKLWYLHSWNEAASTLFEVGDELANSERTHLLSLVFDPQLRPHFHGWENLARRLVSDFQYNTRTIRHIPEYKALWRTLREQPEFRRISSIVYPGGKPAPSFVLQVQHSTLGRLTLRTATTVFTGFSSFSMVSYVPGDQQTLHIYRRQGWQPGDANTLSLPSTRC
jgi:transcriptional regulator with XRE-family HTH domain